MDVNWQFKITAAENKDKSNKNYHINILGIYETTKVEKLKKRD